MKTLLIIIATLISIPVFSQSPTDTIDYQNVNIPYLESLFKEKIEKFRSGLDVPKLIWTDSISVSARKHAKVMSDQNRLFHPNSEYIETCGYFYYTGYVTYDYVATRLINSLLNSPPHKDILMSPNNLGGTGIHFNKINLRFYHVYRGSSDPSLYTEEQKKKILKNAYVK